MGGDQSCREKTTWKGMDAGVSILGVNNEMQSAGPKAELGGRACQGVQGSQALLSAQTSGPGSQDGTQPPRQEPFLEKLNSTAKTNPLLMQSVIY